MIVVVNPAPYVPMVVTERAVCPDGSPNVLCGLEDPWLLPILAPGGYGSRRQIRWLCPFPFDGWRVALS